MKNEDITGLVNDQLKKGLVLKKTWNVDWDEKLVKLFRALKRAISGRPQ